MATKQTQSVTLSVRVQTGTNESGNPTYGNRTISDINPAITTDNAYSVADKYGALQSRTVSSYIMTEKSTLLDE